MDVSRRGPVGVGNRDWIVGLSVAGLMLPEAVAYAGIAGLPPQHAVVAAIAGCLTYSALGRSRFAIVSPTSSSAAILAATLAVLPGSAADRTALMFIIVGLAGLMFVAASVMRLGNMTGFISRPVLRGFAFGLAITIILKQLPVIMAVTVPSSNILQLITGLFAAFAQWNLISIAVSLVAIAALLLLRRVPSLPGAFLVLCGGIVATSVLDLAGHGVALVGPISIALTWPDFSLFQVSRLREVLPYIFPLVLILFAESWGTIRSLSLRHDESVSANRELFALGAANIASAAVQGMPVGAGFSAGSAAEAAGAQSRMTALIAALALAIFVVFAANLVESLPQPVLAAVVIAALTHALDPRPLIRLWRLKRDIGIAAVAAIGVIAFGVVSGIILAIALSLAALLHRLATPSVATLGRLGAGHDFVDIARHGDAHPVPGITIWRPTQPLFFANADAILTDLAAQIAKDKSGNAVIISLEESFDLDSTALDALLEFDALVRRQGRPLQYARVHDRVRDLVVRAAPPLLASFSYSVDDAVAAVLSQEKDPPSAEVPGALS